MFRVSELSRRRLRNFRANRRAFWSLWIFLVLFVISLFAEVVANDKPLLISYKGETFTPITEFYPETTFGGDFDTEADYRDPAVKCLIRTGGLEDCFDIPEDILEVLDAGEYPDGMDPADEGSITWPIIPYSYDTINYDVDAAPSAPDGDHWRGTCSPASSTGFVCRYCSGFRSH